MLLNITWLYVWGVAAVAVGAFSARALVVFGMLPVLEKTHLVQPVNRRYKAILVWGGLRGAVTIVLAMVAAGDQRLPENIREFIALSAVLFVLFTLFVNATTLGLVMHALGLDKLSRLELALRDRVPLVMMLVAARGWPTMLARIGVLRALHRNEEREFNSDRK